MFIIGGDCFPGLAKRAKTFFSSRLGLLPSLTPPPEEEEEEEEVAVGRAKNQ